MTIVERVILKVKVYFKSIRFKKTIIGINDYLRMRGVHLFYVELPVLDKIKGITEFEIERDKTWSFDFNKYKEEFDKLKLLYGADVTPEYILSVFDGGIVVQGNKRKILLDFVSENQHIINGRRVTTGQPDSYTNIIYTHGACTWRGTGVKDSETIASYLQDFINKEYPNRYKVVNSAIGRGSSILDDYQYIMEQNYTTGDIVVLGSHGAASLMAKSSFFRKHSIKYIETSSCFNRPHDYGEWFNDSTLHTNMRGNFVIARRIFEMLKKFDWINNNLDSSTPKKDIVLPRDITTGTKIYGDNPELLSFVTSLKPYRRGDQNSTNGCIVMNCNPFTCGHRYLIEYASSRVDYLYIFVVQENRSYFSFEDRFELVKKGTQDLNNVIVLPSGNFIISATTFPGYFYKDNLKEAKIDCSNDINVFAQYIAPALNISVRFAGEEPLDPVTNQYNLGMKEILPTYGIKFVAIERKKDGECDKVISASRVRECIKNGDFESIKELVPYSTYTYLIEHFKKND